MLTLENVAKSFGGVPVLESVSLAVGPGEVWCLTGPSGLGKSTLLEIMAGLLPPDRGTVRRAAPAGFMFQDDVLLPWLKAADNLAYILPPDLDPAAAAERVAGWLDRFGLPAGQYPAALSGGMRRRLSLARTLASGRRLLILDEPFAFLDEAWQARVAEAVAAQAGAGAAVVLASHTTEPLAGFTHRHLPLGSSPIVIGASR